MRWLRWYLILPMTESQSWLPPKIPCELQTHLPDHQDQCRLASKIETHGQSGRQFIDTKWVGKQRYDNCSATEHLNTPVCGHVWHPNGVRVGIYAIHCFTPNEHQWAPPHPDGRALHPIWCTISDIALWVGEVVQLVSKNIQSEICTLAPLCPTEISSNKMWT